VVRGSLFVSRMVRLVLVASGGPRQPNEQPGLRKGGSVPLSSNCSAPALPPGPSQSRLSTLNQARHSFLTLRSRQATAHVTPSPLCLPSLYLVLKPYPTLSYHVTRQFAISGSKAGQCQKYVYETGFQRYEVDADSEKGIIFQSFAYRTGEDQVSRREWQGDNKKTGGSIMQPEKGAWRFCNLSQLEYMFLADNGSEPETEFERDCNLKEIKQLEEKQTVICSNATKIREWSERIHREENFV
jgi:hypothetical protein